MKLKDKEFIINLVSNSLPILTPESKLFNLHPILLNDFITFKSWICISKNQSETHRNQVEKIINKKQTISSQNQKEKEKKTNYIHKKSGDEFSQHLSAPGKKTLKRIMNKTEIKILKKWIPFWIKRKSLEEMGLFNLNKPRREEEGWWILGNSKQKREIKLEKRGKSLRMCAYVFLWIFRWSFRLKNERAKKD